LGHAIDSSASSLAVVALEPVFQSIDVDATGRTPFFCKALPELPALSPQSI
jgi:hypothetical protein